MGILATLVYVKRTCADRLLRPAGVNDELIRRFLDGRDEATDEKLSKEVAGTRGGAAARHPRAGPVLEVRRRGPKSWDEIQEAGVDMGVDVVVQPFVDKDKLSRIYVNVDSSVLKDFKRAAKSIEAAELAERRYVSAVHFHPLFLFAATKSRKYDPRRGDDRE